LRFYHLSPSEWKALTPFEQQGLKLMMVDISARETFESYQLLATVLGGDEKTRETYLTELADRAFAHDPEVYAKVISSILS
jgi:hypothetical protein